MTLYDANYYQNYHPHPYTDLPFWSGYFGALAEHIVNSITAATVLDVGCAMGVLVNELRQRNVKAHGIDSSKWAIANGVAPKYCTCKSALEVITPRYDLVVCLEVAEHLPERRAGTLVDNLCRASDAVLFSSTPDGDEDATHCNVQPAAYWNRLFIARGYRRDPRREPFHLIPWGQLWRKW